MEIEAIWFLLGFCADAPTLDPTTKSRWRLIKSVFFSNAGVLSEVAVPTDDAKANLSPTKQQLLCCRMEIDRLSNLLSSNALNTVSSEDDEFLIKLLQRCIALQTQECLDSRQSAINGALRLLTESDRNLLSDIWKTSHLLGTDVAAIDEIDFFGLDANDKADENGTLRSTVELMPTSMLLRRCTSLLLTWIRQAPKKKTRLLQLKQSVQKLVTDCLGRASRFEQSVANHNAESTPLSFEEAFDPKSSRSVAATHATAYREAAVRLSVVLSIACCTELAGIQGLAPKYRAILTTELRKMVSPWCGVLQ